MVSTITSRQRASAYDGLELRAARRTVIERCRIDARDMAVLTDELCKYGGGVSLAAPDLEDARADGNVPLRNNRSAVRGGLQLDLKILIGNKRIRGALGEGSGIVASCSER